MIIAFPSWIWTISINSVHVTHTYTQIHKHTLNSANRASRPYDSPSRGNRENDGPPFAELLTSFTTAAMYRLRSNNGLNSFVRCTHNRICVFCVSSEFDFNKPMYRLRAITHSITAEVHIDRKRTQSQCTKKDTLMCIKDHFYFVLCEWRVWIPIAK